MSSFSVKLYNSVFRRSSTFLFAVIAGAFIFERTKELIVDATFDNINKGKQWKDIKHLYAAKKEEE
jgi:hypothetical protein